MYKLLLSSLLLVATPVLSDPAHSTNIDDNRITVSGISAGGQMAHQLHIAYSDLFSGVGIVAGGPYGCADGSLATAMARCMGKLDAPLPISEFVDGINNAVKEGDVADTENLGNDRVWLFHGTQDTTVAAGVSAAIGAIYTEFLPVGQIQSVDDIVSGHTFPAKGQGSSCTTPQTPFVGDCDYDAAGEILNFLYTGLESPVSEPDTTLETVVLPGASEAGLGETAYLFVPEACAKDGDACALHLVLHGCAQSSVTVGTDFIQQSGYLPWAEANNIVLAFPQVVPGPLNPYACWDWWGYTGEDYRWRNGKQMLVLADWIRDL